MSVPNIRIGCASGFWGDSAIAAPQLLRDGALDYLIFDYLAEITMSIMARAREKDSNLGFAPDFVTLVGRHAVEIRDGRVKVIANAGGVNPLACGEAIKRELERQGVALRVATVIGDDLLPRADEFRAGGTHEMFSGTPVPTGLLSMNAYLGARPIAAALDAGADIVVTGRAVDSALALGPCIHAFGWSENDFDLLAAGSLAGHILECGAQSSGGIHTDWLDTGDWANIGYPIAAVRQDGIFTVCKPPATGGRVSFATVAEQLLYEIGDPELYLLPDVTCDFSQVRIAETGPDLVEVSGARGTPPTDSYKVSATYEEGYRVGAYLTVIGEDAALKAERVADAVLRRCVAMLESQGLPPFSQTSVEVIGAEAAYGARSCARKAREVVLKLAAKHDHKAALALLIRELTSSGTSMAPGLTGMGGNRPKASPVVRLFSCLVPKATVTAEIVIDQLRSPAPGALVGDAQVERRPPLPREAPAEEPHMVPLRALAWGRSGDKGNNANIGIIARRPEFLPLIRRALTEETLAECFAHFLEGPVEQFDLPGIHALNFLLHDVLAGGGIASLRNDPQGKGYAQILLDWPIPVPTELFAVLNQTS